MMIMYYRDMQEVKPETEALWPNVKTRRGKQCYGKVSAEEASVACPKPAVNVLILSAYRGL